MRAVGVGEATQAATVGAIQTVAVQAAGTAAQTAVVGKVGTAVQIAAVGRAIGEACI
ncbi:MAG: hypothetical protein Fur0016_26170 [Anaerolineales bacterium]